jgi:hypothetical protein
MNMLTNTVVLFPMERAVITREFQNGSYRMLAYYLARIITSISLQFVYVFAYITILYFLSGMVPIAQEYLIYVLIVSLVGMVAVTLGIIIGALVPSVDLGPSLVTPLLMPLIIFSGYLISISAIKPWFLWIYYLSFFQYAFHVIIVSQFRHLEFDCCCKNSTLANPTCYCLSNVNLMCPPYCGCNAATLNTTYSDAPRYDSCQIGEGCRTGTEFLEQNNINEGIMQQNALILFGMWVVLALIGFYVMLWRGRKKTA